MYIYNVRNFSISRSCYTIYKFDPKKIFSPHPLRHPSFRRGVPQPIQLPPFGARISKAKYPSQQPSIPTSQYPGILTSRYPSILVSQYPNIPASRYPRIQTIRHQNIPVSQHHGIPASRHPGNPTSWYPVLPVSPLSLISRYLSHYISHHPSFSSYLYSLLSHYTSRHLTIISHSPESLITAPHCPVFWLSLLFREHPSIATLPEYHTHPGFFNYLSLAKIS